MEGQRYLVNGREFSAHDPALQVELARVYGTPARPRCLCVHRGVEMYVSKFDEFVIKRMTETAEQHCPTCPSYELPANESGLGQMLGKAIIERDHDVVELRLDFPLTRRVGRSAASDSKSSTQVRVAQEKLSLRGLLHYLWERTGFNRWYPRMQGKRSYWVLRKHLLQACDEIETKGLRLSERVFIPEHFSVDRATEIAERRKQLLSTLLSTDADAQFNMMIAIGEVKELRPTTLGYQFVLKHLPGCALHLERKAGDRAKRTFERELLAWSNGQVKLVAACLIHARLEHCYEVDSVTLMMVGPQWIPLDYACEKDVLEKLVAEERAFIKPLRYEAREGSLFPNFQLLDAGPRPRALDIVSAFLSERERAAKVKAIGTREPQVWQWDTKMGLTIPQLPARVF